MGFLSKSRGYKIRKYKPRKKTGSFIQTYSPKARIKLRKENAVPFIVRLGNRLVFLGGLVSFFASSFLITLRGFFKAGEKVRRISLNNRVVEIKIKKE